MVSRKTQFTNGPPTRLGCFIIDIPQKNRNSQIAIKAAERNQFAKIASEQKDLYEKDLEERKETTSRLFTLLEGVVGQPQSDDRLDALEKKVDRLTSTPLSVLEKVETLLPLLERNENDEVEK